MGVYTNLFRLADNIEIFGPETPYLAAITALMYLVVNTHPEISFGVSLLACYGKSLIARNWTKVTHVMRYLRGDKDFGLSFTKVNKPRVSIGYAEVGYLLD